MQRRPVLKAYNDPNAKASDFAWIDDTERPRVGMCRGETIKSNKG